MFRYSPLKAEPEDKAAEDKAEEERARAHVDQRPVGEVDPHGDGAFGARGLHGRVEVR